MKTRLLPSRSNRDSGLRRLRNSVFVTCAFLAVLVSMGGCATKPVGADQVSTRIAHQQVEKSVLNSDSLSANTVSLLHRYDLDNRVGSDPAGALRDFHQRAVATGDRDLLFALAELSYFTGDRVRKSVKPWDRRDARDYYLGAAVYAYLFLFGEANGEKPDMFDRRVRIACDLYNYGLGWALSEPRNTNGVVRLEAGKRRLPFGEIELRLDASHFPKSLAEVERFVVADQFLVRGLTVRNREAGVGAPLIAVGHENPNLRLRRTAPATVFLRLPNSLGEIAAGQAVGTLELYATFSESTVTIGDAKVPLEADFTASRAYVLNQSFAWQVEKVQFFSPSKGLSSQVILTEPYEPGSVPVVLVHGTFSSPVWWAEMLNTLNADPVLRKRCQIWLFLYSSSKPIVLSACELRDQLTAKIKELDPEGKDPALRQMVVIGHSQGGLLTKLTATDTGDKMWRVFSDKPLEDLDVTQEQRDRIRRLVFYEPLPFVKRVVFISTPHRGSYLAGGFVRRLIRRLVTLPGRIHDQTSDMLGKNPDLRLPETLRGGKMPTSVDGMSPENPVLLALADIPVAPGVTAHSIIPVKGDGDYHSGVDGVVAYQSAHVDYVESELVVRWAHSCQSTPAAIEEVRRILLEHLASYREAAH